MAKELTRKKYEDIRKDYLKMSEIKYKGVKKYSHEYILKKLSEKYYLSPATIEHIVFNRGAYQ